MRPSTPLGLCKKPETIKDFSAHGQKVLPDDIFVNWAKKINKTEFFTGEEIIAEKSKIA